MSNTMHDLLAALAGAPSLPGARCRGSALFDERGHDETEDIAAQRHLQAIGLCRLCPSLGPCRQWVDSLPKAKRPSGVVAGRAPKTVGRPSRTTHKGETA